MSGSFTGQLLYEAQDFPTPPTSTMEDARVRLQHLKEARHAKAQGRESFASPLSEEARLRSALGNYDGAMGALRRELARLQAARAALKNEGVELPDLLEALGLK